MQVLVEWVPTYSKPMTIDRDMDTRKAPRPADLSVRCETVDVHWCH
jgi:hypothetical protein